MLWALQQAVYGRLTGDATLMAKVTGVYDQTPQGGAHPYVVIGEDDARPFDDDRATGFDVECTVHVWGVAHRGRKEVKDIQADVHRLFHRALLPVTGADPIESTVLFTETFVDPDGITHHGVQRLRVVCQEED